MPLMLVAQIFSGNVAFIRHVKKIPIERPLESLRFSCDVVNLQGFPVELT